MLIEIGLFQGNELLQRSRIKVTELERFEENDQISVKHQLVDNGNCSWSGCLFDVASPVLVAEATVAKADSIHSSPGCSLGYTVRVSISSSIAIGCCKPIANVTS